MQIQTTNFQKQQLEKKTGNNLQIQSRQTAQDKQPNSPGKNEDQMIKSDIKPAKVLKQAKSDTNFIGVPPDMTESLNKHNNVSQQQEFMEDQDDVDIEDEMEAHNNFLTQAELFKSYAE